MSPGADRAAARAYGVVRSALRAIGRDRNLVLVFISGALGGGGRGLGVLNVFVPLYLSLVLHLDDATVALMYTALVILSVPGPIVAGHAVGPLRPQAADPGGVHRRRRVARSRSCSPVTTQTMLWITILLLGIFNFVESPQLQALLSDI